VISSRCSFSKEQTCCPLDRDILWHKLEVSRKFHAPAILPESKESPGRLGGLVGPKAGLGVVEKRTICTVLVILPTKLPCSRSSSSSSSSSSSVTERETQKSLSQGRLGKSVFSVGVQNLRVRCIELASRHPSGACSLEVASRFLSNLFTPGPSYPDSLQLQNTSYYGIAVI
jgi:hypothetical protein